MMMTDPYMFFQFIDEGTSGTTGFLTLFYWQIV